MILVLVAITGLSAFSAASRAQPRSMWPIALGLLTLLGVVGPVISLLVFRDSPDTFVLMATVLTALVPVAALIYGFQRRPGSPS